MNYALFAENEYLVKKELDKLIKQLNEKYDCETVEYDGNDKDFNMETLLNDLNTFLFLSEHRIVVLNNPTFISASKALSDKDSNLFENYLKSPADFSSLIIYVDNFKVDNRKKATKLIKKYSEVYEASVLDDRAIESIVRSDLVKNNVHLENDAMRELLRRVTPLFDNWPMELEKLILNNKEIITLKDITLLISMSDGDNIFDLVNGVLNKNINQTLNIYRNLALSSKEPISLIMLLANQFRLLYQVKTLSDDNKSERDIASELKVHPYRVKISKGIAYKYSYMAILSVLNKLASLEQNIKNGLINPEIGFELFLVEVCT